MARYSKRRPGKYSYRRKRKTGWKRRKAAAAARKGKKHYYFTRQVDLGTISAARLTDATGIYTFKLNDLPNYTDFTALYDQYKIAAVKIRFMPCQNVVKVQPDAMGVVISYAPRLFTVIDYDAGTFSTVNELRQYQSCKTVMGYRPVSMYLKPCWASEIYRTAALTGYGPKRGFIDCSYVDVPHYSIKWGFEPYDPSGTQQSSEYTYRVEAKYYITTRTVR